MFKIEKFSKTAERLQSAKSEMIGALRTADAERVPASIIRQLEALTGKLEALQAKLACAAA